MPANAGKTNYTVFCTHKNPEGPLKALPDVVSR